MSVFRIPFCTHKIIISKSYAFGNLNPPSKAGGIAVAIFSKRVGLFLMNYPPEPYTYKFCSPFSLQLCEFFREHHAEDSSYFSLYHFPKK